MLVFLWLYELLYEIEVFCHKTNLFQNFYSRATTDSTENAIKASSTESVPSAESFQKKREKRDHKSSVRIRKPECYKSRRAAGAVMRMQETVGTTLAALLVRFE